jgi:hypothetical protein
LYIDLVILGVGADKADICHAIGIIDPDQQPILVAGNVEHYPTILKNTGGPEVLIAESGRVSIHGHIWLNQDALELEVNSTARAVRGKAFIQSLLGQYLGEPLTVHENLEKALEDSDFSAAPDPMDLNANPELQALLQAQLTTHTAKPWMSPYQC